MLLYIVRHGDPVYETDSLTDRGKLQAEAVGKRLFDAKVDRIFSSPMGRATETAEPACQMLGLKKNIEEWACEIEDESFIPFLDGKMKSIISVQNTYYLENGNIDLPYDRAYECRGINQSDMELAVKRIERKGNEFLERLGYREENGIYRILRNNDEKVALFCHAVFSYAWMSVLLHIPLHIMCSSFKNTHTGVTIVEFQNNENGITAPRCLCYSDVSHLYASGLDLWHDNRIEI